MVDITISIKEEGSKPLMNMGHAATRVPGHPFSPTKVEDPMMPKKMESGYEIGYNAPGWTGKFEDYTVVEGDTLESIAEKYKCKPKDLALLNEKQGNMISDQVNVGQKIKVPLMDDKKEDDNEQE